MQNTTEELIVYRFNVWFDNDDDKQVRFVLAKTEEEAKHKLEEESINLEKNGFMPYRHTAGPWVELFGVVY